MHTPGPWEISRDGSCVVAAKEHEYGIVASLGRDSLERTANARLIAAAPELAKFVRVVAHNLQAYNLAREARTLLAMIDGKEAPCPAP